MTNRMLLQQLGDLEYFESRNFLKILIQKTILFGWTAVSILEIQK
jgi:hypothetical protein